MTKETEKRSGLASAENEFGANARPSEDVDAWIAQWIARPVKDYRSWDVHTLEVRASLEEGGIAEIRLAVQGTEHCRALELNAADGSVALHDVRGGERREAARGNAPELGKPEPDSGEDGMPELRQAGPNEAEAVDRKLREVAVRVVQEQERMHVYLNGREALAADMPVSNAAEFDRQAGVVERSGSVGFRSGDAASAVFRELRLYDAEGRALYVNRFYDPSTLHFSAGGIDPSGSGLRLSPGETALCENPLPVDSPLFRRAFSLPSPPVGARLRAYALGWYELTLNGKRIGDRVLAPANTPYGERMLFDVYEADELLELLQAGDNVLGAMLGNGYNFNYSRWGWKWKRDKALILQLDLTFADGGMMTIGTDESWTSAPGPLLMQDIYDGETCDARRKPENWDVPEHSAVSGAKTVAAEDWTPVVIAPAPEGALKPNGQPPIRAHRPLDALCAYQPEPGLTVYDFGQNIAGWARIQVRGKSGDEVELLYSELIDERGALDPWTNRNANARDLYILSGQETETYEPAFTYHGFRYVQVRTTANLSRVQAVPVHADVKESGSFRSSDPLLEQIQANIRRSILNNLVSIPTDCCQRDERTPCLMDSAVVEEAAMRNFDMKTYYRKWMHDIAGSDSNPDWSGDRVTLPWHLYRHYGDPDLLREGYPSMKAYLHYLAERWPEHIVTEGFGDWCPPNDDGWENYFGAPELVNTALYAMHAGVAARAAEALGHAEDAVRFRTLAEKSGAAFHRHFHRGEGVYGSGSQTSQLLPLAFGLVPADYVEGAVRRLVAAIEEAGRRLDTGIYGTRYLLDVLADHGRVDLAYEMLTAREYPSFGWQIAQGATTLWEQWSFKGGMHSHDHAMFGGIGASFYTRLAGIEPLEPGYAKIGIRPHAPAGLEWAEAELDTPAGRIFSGWRREEGRLVLKLDIPEGASANVTLPVDTGGLRASAAEPGSLAEASRPASGRSLSEKRTVEIGPGRHEFNFPVGAASTLPLLTKTSGSADYANFANEAGG
ncbi:alpha-L-rhamnosidase [Saccharibacillus endophyticus]|uniref:alpha-L-rhamnosidase n=1 Tax=Saccharibacillus endophyticus TaxID=2060666 RepID=A0ABQ1ZRQ7_9BACL|nr:alpha-L-rhamnosidase [Saccharibacillus endophyticus]GGH77210.1 hypothetical protein GCM10007362_20620 [Saccharibacillus endophyticus]